MWIIWCLMLVIVSGKELTDEEYYRMPRVFHLDDYEACLSRRGGLYCLGAFRLAPRSAGDPVYDLMLEYSKIPQNFNRTVVRRGYCVSSRCPLEDPSDRNNSWRFERCVARWAQAQGFHSTPHSIEYCRTTEQRQAKASSEVDTPVIVFTAVVLCVLFLNVVGTVYDLNTPDSDKKSPLLMAWSARSNWRRLTDCTGRAPDLAPLSGVRVVVILLVVNLHGGLFYYMTYTYNTRSLEHMMRTPVVEPVRNGTSLVEMFVLLSNFLLAHQLLRQARTHSVGLRLLPKIWLARFIRLSALHLLAVGFAGTYWPLLGDGPMWHAVETSARVCRRKFWAHLLMLQNLVDPYNQCMLQTWFVAVDMQLFLLTSVLALLLLPRRRWALPVLGTLLAASIAANGYFAYLFGWKTLYLELTAENAHAQFVGVASLALYYAAPWGSLPAALLGLGLAFLHASLQEKGFHIHHHKWLTCVCRYSVPLIVAYMASGAAAHHITSKLGIAIYVALERPIFSLLCALLLFGLVNNVDNTFRRVLSWRGFAVAGRVTLAALLLHWPLELGLHARSQVPLSYSHYGFLYGFVSTSVLTYALCIPITVLFETPFQRMLTAMF
ncbi:O-acyltransferase like protein-like [Ostrinia furnacalis]|uniref:O-acyltransferase like protein-like n=1 Tax=Ostrinia furnacalis TaxID=93504 RepID=UPI00103A50C3|nr:O-acyltransferase like protein-like [Ostrinia furnacalis]